MSATNLTWSGLVSRPGLCGETEPWHGPEINLHYTPTKIFVSELTQSSVCFHSKDQSKKALAGNNSYLL